ncbi:BglG family transcription antiterminator [Virgibacillus sp. Bac330]|uniref:BglG family transcription antiterminator n=1 Tax=Virgibacillus sp. Bac330 TaxID=2419841 RepID=UPI000EF44C5C|nr:BglG family transcription antiterminator [Virgibacillus sp. Bac330]
MNARQRKIIEALLSYGNRPILVNDLAKQLDCSEKTVRNDLRTIDVYLQNYSSACLIRKPGTGIYLEINNSDKQDLFHALFRENKSSYQRLMEIAYRLLTDKNPLTLQQLSMDYYVHHTAIKSDLEAIQQWFESFGLIIESRQKLGHYVKGEELNKRMALAHIEEMVNQSATAFLKNVFAPFEIATVRQILNQMIEKWKIPMTSHALDNLVVHVLVMVQRTKQASPIVIDKQSASMSETNEYRAAAWCLDQLEHKFGITLAQDETIYLTWHLRGSKKYSLHTSTEEEITRQVLSTMIETMQQLTHVSFHEDEQLINGLMIHLEAVTNRLLYGFPISNPLLQDIKKMYPYMLSMVTLSLEKVSEKFPFDIPEEEAAYIVLHFQASIERLDAENYAVPRVLIVCDMGIGMSRLLQAKVEKQYQEMKIVGTVGKGEVQRFIKREQVHLIISTTPIEKINIPTIIISPLLEATDKEKLQRFLKKKAGRSSVLATSPQVLHDFIEEELLFLNINPQHRFQVVEMLGNALYKQGKVEKSYVHQALLRERKSATAIGGAIAIPHGDPTLVIASTIAIAVLTEPLEWGKEEVSIVFMLALANEKANPIKAIIHKLSSLSNDPMTVRDLLNATDKQAFLRVLTEKEW